MLLIKFHTEHSSKYCYQLEKIEILDDVSWIHSLPSPGAWARSGTY
jgi:hypothetical protein